ncbi:helix-turn-helix domain-containing protein (plasmid) [Ensifer sp. PDNC004]|uniref:helix-turn-helix domain-containing protein n=1 Tax=Ensifer sp. PDNC004 TaxID=2811423 RepID=UPI00196352F4|nr:helix-turn-helix domain-containing protein [Ensifer sp. PDNC004]QRY70603.1 helix-turn-helix domain-containing protein [Ensifer sp. PDNC004]
MEWMATSSSFTDGTSEDRQGRHLACPGDSYVLDMAQPIATSFTDHSHLSLVVPRRMLAPLLKAPDKCHERVLPAELPLVALLRDTMASYFQNLKDMPVEAGHAVLRPLLDLVAVALCGQVDEERAGSLNLALFSRVRRYFEANLLDPTLTAHGVGAAFGVSRPSLYRMFEPMGGSTHYLQERRLGRAHAALRAVETRNVPIATIADKHGFPNPENFSRAFRRMFDMTPREVRGLALSVAQRPHGREPQSAWSHWIGQIGK